MGLVKNLKYLYCFYYGKIPLKKVLADVLDRKLAFLDHRNTAL